MRNDDHDEIDLSQHRASRLPVVLVIVAALGVALAAAWVFTPMLMSKDSAATAGLFSKTKPQTPAPDQPAAPKLASAQSMPAPQPEPNTTATASIDNPSAAPAAAPGPVVASASATPWPQNRGIQAEANAAPAPANADMQVAAVAPQDTPAEPIDNVPLPRRRPSRLIEASLSVPLPRPRPEIEGDTPPELSPFERQVERMR
jgi:cytoskeletal protein RodZ